MIKEPQILISVNIDSSGTSELEENLPKHSYNAFSLNSLNA